MIPIVYRSLVDSDIPYVLDTFLHGARLPTFGKMVAKVYYRRYKPVLKTLLGRASTLIACLPDDPNTIVGYVTYESIDSIPIIHWIHVKPMFQNQGVARSLVAQIAPGFGSSLTMVSHVPQKKESLDFYRLTKKYNVQLDQFLVYGI